MGRLKSKKYMSLVVSVVMIGAAVGVVGCSSGASDPAPSPTAPSNSTSPVVVFSGLWTAKMTTTGNASYPTLEVLFEQDGGNLSGSNRDNQQEVDVATTGSVDGSGNITLKSTLTNGGSPRATITFTGKVSGSGSNQTISGGYRAVGPSANGGDESGSFKMSHN